MLLKKQTVWLLTMLSLVIVLSVYYITSPTTQQATDMAAVENEGQQVGAEGEEQTMTNEEMEIVTEAAGDEMFEALRLDINDERAQLEEQLTAKLGDAGLSTDEKNAAYQQMEDLKQLAIVEAALETMIISMGYDDALVRADGNNIKVTVKAEEHSATAANDILRKVQSEIGEMGNVAVTFQPLN